MSLKFLLANVLLSVFLFSGIIFGWGSLQKILLAEHDGYGQFHELCQGMNVTNPCEAQLAKLNIIYTLGTFTLSLVSLPGGWFLDTFGVRNTVALSALFEISGLLIFGHSDSLTFDYFIPGAILMSAGGFLIMVSAFPVSFLFPKWQTVILAAVSCLFDASSITFQLFDPLISITTRSNLFMIYAGIAGVVYTLLILQWSCIPKNKSDNDHENNNDSEKNNDPENNNQNDLNTSVNSSKDSTETIQIKMHDRSITQQLRSFEFVFILIFASIQQLRANTYIGLNDQVLFYYGDDGTYIGIFGYMLPAGVLMIPVIDIAVTKLGLVGALHSTNLLGVAYGVFVLFSNLRLQIVTFVFFAGYRAFLYSVMSTFNAQVFGLRTLGRITGFVFTGSAIFQLLQTPIVKSISTIFHKDPFYPMVGLVSLSAIIVPFVFYFQCKQKRDQESNNKSTLKSRLLDGVEDENDEEYLESPLHKASSFLRSPSSHEARGRGRERWNKIRNNLGSLSA